MIALRCDALVADHFPARTAAVVPRKTASTTTRSSIGQRRAGGLRGETQLRGVPQRTGNAFEGMSGFDYMGLSMDFLGGKIFGAPPQLHLWYSLAGLILICAFARQGFWV